MILSDKTLMKMLDEHTLVVDPIETEQIQPASIDIRMVIHTVLSRTHRLY